ncbi:lipase/acyltransferase domain-containing protein [Arthrobacter rhombi]|uniref:lipase/acyltransferase domain-containing protein n=1 Tax=Arthrobacter rhombi TaxID=71253 RepID=UPI003FD22ECB
MSSIHNHVRSLSAAAVIVVPGIMGSELKEGERTVWGARSLRWYFDHWKEHQFGPLLLTEDEREGKFGRIRPTALLSSPAFFPKFGAVNPYTGLVARLRRESVNSEAIAEFPYDWRLPVAQNAKLLAQFIEVHAAAWRAHPALLEHLAVFPGTSTKVVVVAHSMGGLIARHAAERVHVDRIVALGTPWQGSLMSLSAMSTGQLEKLPFSAGAVRNLALSIPGMYDMLPRWSCVAPARREDDPGPLDTHLIEVIGGDRSLFENAEDAYKQRTGTKGEVKVVAIAGISQPTAGSVLVEGEALKPTDGAYVRSDGSYERDARGHLVSTSCSGDGTVPVFSASLNQHFARSYQCLQHGQLASAPEGQKLAAHFVASSEELTFLKGVSDVGVKVPSMNLKRSAVETEVSVNDPTLPIRIDVLDEDGRVVERPRPVLREGIFFAPVPTEDEGIYTVQVDDGHGTPVEASYIVLGE